MSEDTTTKQPKVTEAHESLQRWLANSDDGPKIDIPVEHVSAVVLYFPKWQRSDERVAERAEFERTRDEREQAKRDYRDWLQAEKRWRDDEKRRLKREEQDNKRATQDWLRAEKRWKDDEARKQKEAEKAAAKAKADAEKAQKAKEADERKAAGQAEGADGDDSTSAPANGEQTTGRGALQDAKRANRKLKRRSESQEAVGASAGDF